MKLNTEKIKLPLICLMGSIALYVGLTATIPDETTITRIERPAENSAGAKRLVVEGLSDKQYELDFEIDQKRYNKEEAEARIEKAAQEIQTWILKDNTDLQCIQSDLELITYLEDDDITVTWHSSAPEIIDDKGKVDAGAIDTETEVLLRCNLTDGETSKEYEYSVCVLPKEYTEEESMVRRFVDYVEESDKNQTAKDEFILPEYYEGKKIIYREPSDNSYGAILLCGIAVAILLYINGIQKENDKIKIRKQKLLLDYPRLISGLMLYLGAGLSVRTVWGILSEQYAGNGKELKPMEEEVSIVDGKLKNGTPEYTAYREFGKRCELKEYIKLAGLLEQNTRTGVADLKNILYLESVGAWEERKNQAKRAGEEAGTKLLLPLLMMLVVVIVMVMVPAFLGMN